MNSAAFKGFSLQVEGEHSEIRWNIEDILWLEPPQGEMRDNLAVCLGLRRMGQFAKRDIFLRDRPFTAPSCDELGPVYYYLWG